MRNYLLIGLTGAFATMVAPAFAADCELVDKKFEQRVAENPASREAFHNRLIKDLRQLRKTALKLQTMGYADACATVMTTIKDIRDNPKAVRMHLLANSDPDEVNMNYYERQQLAMKRAKSLSEIGGIHSGDIVGVEVYGKKGKSVGEIDDIIVSADDRKAFAVVSFGGFLGFGEEQVAVPLSKIKIDGTGDAVFIPITGQAIQRAPRFKTGTRDWISDEKWLDKNFNFYSE